MKDTAGTAGAGKKKRKPPAHLETVSEVSNLHSSAGFLQG